MNPIIAAIALSKMHSPKKACEYYSSLLLDDDIESQLLRFGVDTQQIDTAHELYFGLNDVNAHVLGMIGYPLHLSSIRNPPLVLYSRGNTKLLKQPGIAIVGTRKATQNGITIAKRLAIACVEQNISVISGLALGIDAAAHSGALSNTIAVLASGLHEATPSQNARLGSDILNNGGLWVSQHPPGTSARKENFVPRNRIQVGLSGASIIVESEIKSGTATHAKFCIDEKHTLFTVLSDKSLGLLSEGPQHFVDTLGAIPLRTKEDYPKLWQSMSLI